MNVLNAYKNQDNIKPEPDLLKLITSILSIYNCRISEILSASWSNFYPERFLILKGAKKSQNIIVTDRIILNSIANLPKTHQVLIFPYISYYQVYHYIKSRYGHLFAKIKHRKNLKITHAFRYLNLESIDNDNFIKDILHHNSLKSGKFYKNKLKEH